MSRDLKNYMTSRLKKNTKASFVFIGYSFGAGTLPFALNRLPLRIQEKIELVILIAPPAKADFEFFFRSWLHKATDKAKPVAPEIRTLSIQTPVLYIYGVSDYVGARAELSPNPNLRFAPLKGGHTFNKDYACLFDTIQATLSLAEYKK